MKYFFLLFLCLGISQAYAQEEQKYDVMGNPINVLRVIESSSNPVKEYFLVEFPPCDDLNFINNVKKAISDNEKKLKKESIIEYRYRILAQKSITNFFDQSLENFSPQENRDIANIIASAKTNGSYQDSDFKICSGDNSVLKRKVYLLLQKYSDTEIMVRIINYLPQQILHFIYKKT